jgi:hypothetical protein
MKTVAEEIRESIADIKSARDEMQAMLKQTDERIAELTAMAVKLTKPERIRVPENIKFEEYLGGIALVSPNGKCILTASKVFGGIPIVQPSEENDRFKVTDPLYLKPCKRADLRRGDVALCFGEYCTLSSSDDSVSNYVVILNNTDYAYWSNDMSMTVEDYNGLANWYKVVR